MRQLKSIFSSNLNNFFHSPACHRFLFDFSPPLRDDVCMSDKCLSSSEMWWWCCCCSRMWVSQPSMWLAFNYGDSPDPSHTQRMGGLIELRESELPGQYSAAKALSLAASLGHIIRRSTSQGWPMAWDNGFRAGTYHFPPKKPYSSHHFNVFGSI